MALIFDTGPLYAALDTSDADHLASKRLIDNANEELVIPAPVLSEVEYLLSSRGYEGAFIAVLDDVIDGAFRIEDPSAADYLRIREVLDRYRDLRIGFVDAAVIAVVERLGEPKLAPLDHRHFRTVRPRHVDALQLLPE